jgi:hypothetical protein
MPCTGGAGSATTAVPNQLVHHLQAVEAECAALHAEIARLREAIQASQRLTAAALARAATAMAEGAIYRGIERALVASEDGFAARYT